MSRVDVALAARLARAVGEAMAAAAIEREAEGRPRLPVDDLQQLAARLVAAELDQVANDQLRRREDLLSPADEAALFAAVLADVQGLGRTSLTSTILTCRTSTSAGVTRCGSSCGTARGVAADPVADTDEELVDLVRLVVARMGRSERRFDAANPELNVQLPDGSRLFATMEVLGPPQRRHPPPSLRAVLTRRAAGPGPRRPGPATRS